MIDHQASRITKKNTQDKHANIMLQAGKPEVVLIDFGLAGNQDDTITMNQTTREEGFTAPELYDPTEKAQPYTDVYSLGATLYALLSGQSPPSAEERAKKGKDKLPPLPKDIDNRICRAIERAMEPVWEKRLQTVDEFLSLLGLSIGEKSTSNPTDQEALAETRRQTRIGIYTLYVTAISIFVGILLTLFGQELKSFFMNPLSPPVPEQKPK